MVSSEKLKPRHETKHMGLEIKKYAEAWIEMDLLCEQCVVRTKTMVEDPVTAKTVQIKTISRYQAQVWRGGISLGSKNRCQNVLLLLMLEEEEDDDDADDDALFVVPLVAASAAVVAGDGWWLLLRTTRRTFSTSPLGVLEDDADDISLLAPVGVDVNLFFWQTRPLPPPSRGSADWAARNSGPVEKRCNALLLLHVVVVVIVKKLDMVDDGDGDDLLDPLNASCES
jgi:hypothetical protein